MCFLWVFVPAAETLVHVVISISLERHYDPLSGGSGGDGRRRTCLQKSHPNLSWKHTKCFRGACEIMWGHLKSHWLMWIAHTTQRVQKMHIHHKNFMTTSGCQYVRKRIAALAACQVMQLMVRRGKLKSGDFEIEIFSAHSYLLILLKIRCCGKYCTFIGKDVSTEPLTVGFKS